MRLDDLYGALLSELDGKPVGHRVSQTSFQRRHRTGFSHVGTLFDRADDDGLITFDGRMWRRTGKPIS